MCVSLEKLVCAIVKIVNSDLFHLLLHKLGCFPKRINIWKSIHPRHSIVCHFSVYDIEGERLDTKVTRSHREESPKCLFMSETLFEWSVIFFKRGSVTISVSKRRMLFKFCCRNNELNDVFTNHFYGYQRKLQTLLDRL